MWSCETINFVNLFCHEGINSHDIVVVRLVMFVVKLQINPCNLPYLKPATARGRRGTRNPLYANRNKHHFADALKMVFMPESIKTSNAAVACILYL